MKLNFIQCQWANLVTSYILGHAICEGYIDGVDTKLNDWPILKNSLYS